VVRVLHVPHAAIEPRLLVLAARRFILHGMDEGRREKESDAARRSGNLVLLVFFVVIVGIGLWLVNALDTIPIRGMSHQGVARPEFV
jgi:hypothetical protein